MKSLFFLLSFIILTRANTKSNIFKILNNNNDRLSINGINNIPNLTNESKINTTTKTIIMHSTINMINNNNVKYNNNLYTEKKTHQANKTNLANYSSDSNELLTGITNIKFLKNENHYKRFLQNSNNNNNSTKNNNNNSNSDINNQIQKIFYEEMNFTLCGSSICNDAGGLCLGIDKCECAEGYLNPKDNSIFKCTYKQYDAKIAFFLEFFLGFGSGHFYVKRYFNGMLKFCVYSFLYLFTVVINLYMHYKRNENDLEDMISAESPYCRFARIMFMCSCFFTCIIWQISDSILFYSKFYNDGNDFPLHLYQ